MSHATLPASEPTALDRLVASHRQFLAFLERRTGSREEAEEVLQAAFVRTIERADSLNADENVIAWFYRLLRNALIDRARRREVEGRALHRAALDLDEPAEMELRDVVCACVTELVETLRPDYSAIIKDVDLRGELIAAVAERASITPNNARVRLHRAREALRHSLVDCCGTCADHGCRDCSCER